MFHPEAFYETACSPSMSAILQGKLSGFWRLECDDSAITPVARALLSFLLLLNLCFCPVSAHAAVSAPNGASQHENESGQADMDMMLGSMLMLGFREASLTAADPFMNMIKEGKIGNFILFDKDVTSGEARNILSRDQVRSLTSQLYASAPGPIFIGIDQEGGQVRRLKPQKGFVDLPSAQAMGQASPKATYEAAFKTGEELKEIGINLDFAPVVDIDTNPFNPAIGRLGRSFGTETATVTSHALSFGRGLAKSGVIPCLKHFPGQGCSNEDSHLSLPDLTQCWQADVDLAPFAQIIQAGWPGMIMIGHLFHAGLDEDYPASLSYRTVTGLLREGLGWNGVVISDDLQMKAIYQDRDLKEIFFLAINAGIDILLLGNNIEWDESLPQRAWTALKSLVDEGAVSRERIEESFRRIQALHNAYQ